MAQDTIHPNSPGLDYALAFKEVNPVVKTITGAAYTPELADVEKLLAFTAAGAAVLTLPPGSEVPFPHGTVLNVARKGAGAVTIAAGAGVTIEIEAGRAASIAAQHSLIGITKTGSNTWTLVGALAAA